MKTAPPRPKAHKKQRRRPPQPKRPAIVSAAIAAVGGATEMAKLAGHSRQGVNKWPRVPVEIVLAIELATAGRIRAHAMAPKIYPKWLTTWPRPHKATAGGAAGLPDAPHVETPAAPSQITAELERLGTFKGAARRAGVL